jgi:protein associated with RNAse G/E
MPPNPRSLGGPKLFRPYCGSSSCGATVAGRGDWFILAHLQMNDFFMHSKKFDGSLHYRYPIRTIARSDDRLVTFFEPGAPVESYRGSWKGTRHMLSVFWLNRPFVLHVIWDPAWQPMMLYVDIAADTIWNDVAVGYVDMDLDLILRPDSPLVHLDDENEFEANRLRWKYPTELVSRCHDAAEEVRRLFAEGVPPFTPAMFTWRPGSPLPF